MINKKLYFTIAIAMFVAVIGASTPLRAHDTDIYVSGAGPLGAEPIVIFTLDYRSNLGSTVCNGTECQSLIDDGYLASAPTTFFNLIRAVFKKVLDPLGGFKLGLMINHANDNNCAGPGLSGCSNGGMIYLGANLMTAGSDDPDKYDTIGEDAEKLKLFAKLDAMPIPGGSVAHSFQGKELYFELFRYLTGQEIYNGHNGYTDFGTDSAYNLDNKQDLSDGDATVANIVWDTDIEASKNSDPAGEKYLSPLNSANGGKDCTGIYVINMMFQVSQQESDSDTAIIADQVAGGMAIGTTEVNIKGVNNTFDTVVRWMYDVDLADGSFGAAEDLNGKQNVTSFFLVDPSKINKTTNGYAQAGGTNRALPLSSDPEELEKELSSLFTQILSVSTTFVAPTVAVNVYNRSEILDDIFFAMFEANASGQPAWSGNVKKFRLDEKDSIISVVDANGSDAVSAIDGRMKPEALSFWTIAGDLPDPGPTDDFKALADGRFIERGGCGSLIPGFDPTCASGSCTGTESPGEKNSDTGARTLYTEPDSFPNDGTPTAPVAFDTTLVTDADVITRLGASAAGTCAAAEAWDTACNLIRYARGLHDDGTNRSWLLGDSLHSRPIAINYGEINSHPKDNPDIRLYVGSNDGFLHMIRNTTAGGAEDGAEGWAFMPRTAMSVIKPLKEGLTTTPHLYGVDSAPVAAIYDSDNNGTIDLNGTDFAHLFFGFRRGGRAYYALDVTNPDDPKILWKVDNTTTGYTNLGETWSEPHVGQMLVDGSNTSTTVLIYGGGYDSNKDDNSNGWHAAAAGGTDSIGRGIYITNAKTGALIWKAEYAATTGAITGGRGHQDMLHSIPSNVTAIDSDGNKLIDRIYVGDTGGNVWRVDTRANEPFTAGQEWSITHLFQATVNGENGTPDGTTTDRRFFYRPDYIQSRDANDKRFDAITIGSGDRADPLTISNDDYFYVIHDYDVISGTPPAGPLTHAELGNVTTNCLQDNSCGTDPDLTKGWKRSLLCPWQTDISLPCGEKAVAPSLAFGNELFFVTYQPANSSSSNDCKPSEGKSFVYTVNLKNGTATRDYDTTTLGLTTKDLWTEASSDGMSGGITNIGSSEGGGGGTGYCEGPKCDGKLNIKSGYRTFWYENDAY